jgi:hypothetical protein
MKKLSPNLPEKVFLGYAVLMLALLAGASVGRMIVCGIAFEVFALPVGWLLGLGGWYSVLPDGVQYFVAYLAALANGALLYSLLKIVLRKPHLVAEEPIQLPETTRGK